VGSKLHGLRPPWPAQGGWPVLGQSQIRPTPPGARPGGKTVLKRAFGAVWKRKTGLRGCMEEGKCGGAKHRAPPTIDQTVVSPTQTRSGWAYKIQTTPPVGALEVRDLQEKTGRFYVKCTPGRVRLSWARARRAWRGPALVPKNLSKID